MPDARGSVAELLRVAEFGLPTGVIFDWVFAPEPVMHQIWEPVWAAAAEPGCRSICTPIQAAGRARSGLGLQGLEPRNQSLMRVANFPMGAMAELMSAVVFSGICDRHPGVRFVLEEAGVGWVPFMFWRFDREYEFGGPESRVFAPDIPLSKSRANLSANSSSSPSRSRKKRGSGGYPRSASAISCGPATFRVSTVRGRTRRRWAMPPSRRRSGKRRSTSWCSRTR